MNTFLYHNLIEILTLERQEIKDCEAGWSRESLENILRLPGSINE